MINFRRDPALYVSLAVTLIRLITGFMINFSGDQQAVINAVAAAAGGFVVASIVHDGQPAAILGVVNALIALALGFGLDVTPENQAMIMSAVGTAIAAFVRTQVTAPVPARL